MNDAASNSVFWAPAQLSQEPNTTNAAAAYGNSTANAYYAGRTDGVYGVDVVEATVTPVAHAGWILETIGSGGRAGRIIRETLVATSGITGDGSDDTQFPDFTIFFTTQPVNNTAAANSAASFTAVANTKPSGKTISYQWQIDATSNGDFVDLSDAGVYSNTATSVLYISNNAGLGSATYHVVVSGTGAKDATSDGVVLTLGA
jgi:hypothetical protein